MTWTLAFVGASTAIAGAAFMRVGATLRRRALARRDDERALRAFSTWWLAMGASTICVGGMAIAALPPAPSVMLVTLLRAVSLVFLSIALWGLLSHVVYLYTGRSAERPIALVYAGLTAVVLGHMAWAQPNGVDVTAWTVEVRLAREGLALSTALLIGAYLLPPVVAGLAYVRLAPRADDPANARRLRIVGWGIVLWISAHLLARASEAGAWQLATRIVLGSAVAYAVWRAYVPGAPRESERESEQGLDERARLLI